MRMKETSNLLDQFRKAIARCVRCGSCSSVCPVFVHDRRESQSPRGRMALVEAVLEGRIAPSVLYTDRLTTCAGCMACEAQCASGVPVTEIIHIALEQASRENGRGMLPALIGGALKHEFAMQPLSRLAPVALHLGRESMAGGGKRWSSAVSANREIPEQAAGGKGTVLFFPGCAIRYFQPDIGSATANVLKHLGYDVVVPTDLKCCGRPFLSLGDGRAARYLAEHNTAVFAGHPVHAVITSCASCALTFKREYPKLLAQSGRRPVPVLDIHEFLAQRLAEAVLQPLSEQITWHDPCHLGRGQGLAKEVRKVLQSIPGLELIAMDHADRCCGFGGPMRVRHAGLAASIGRTKALDIIRTKAPIVVTGCPACRMQIADSLRREGADRTVVHTVQLIERALGVRTRTTGGCRQRAVLSSGS